MKQEILEFIFSWKGALIMIIFIICITLIILNHYPFVFRIEMDNNTLEAVRSINYSAINSP